MLSLCGAPQLSMGLFHLALHKGKQMEFMTGLITVIPMERSINELIISSQVTQHYVMILLPFSKVYCEDKV